MNDSNGQLLLTAKCAAKALSISERKLWSLTNCGDVPSVRIGRSVRYDPLDLREWISRNKTGRVDRNGRQRKVIAG